MTSVDSAQRQFPALFTELPNLLAAATDVCREAGLDADAIHRVQLVLEEAFSNSIHHGYGTQGSSGLVWLAWEILPDGVRLVYQDAAPAFDPLRSQQLAHARNAGGFGRALIKSLPRRVSFRFEDNRNTLELEFARSR